MGEDGEEDIKPHSSPYLKRLPSGRGDVISVGTRPPGECTTIEWILLIALPISTVENVCTVLRYDTVS